MKFEVEKIYVRPGLYTPDFLVKVVSRTDSKIVVEELNFPGEYTTHKVFCDGAGNESAQVWEYCGIKGYMRA